MLINTLIHIEIKQYLDRNEVIDDVFYSEHKYLLYSGWVFSSGNEIGLTVPQSVHQINIVVVGERAFSITNLLKKNSCTSYLKKKSSAFVLFLI